jgi:hypothetical protein
MKSTDVKNNERGLSPEYFEKLEHLAGAVAEEEGVPQTEVMEGVLENIDRIQQLKKSGEGKYKVVGVDKFDWSDWVQGEYDTAEEAIRIARALTKGCMKNASCFEIATIYHAYDPEGKYLGGDTWHDE